ncbi:hypothetical protein ACFL5K_05895 [Gemmatimonadota bacterium]
MKVGFDSSLRLDFYGSKVSSDAGLLVYRDLDEALGLFGVALNVMRHFTIYRPVMMLRKGIEKDTLTQLKLEGC